MTLQFNSFIFLLPNCHFALTMTSLVDANYFFCFQVNSQFVAGNRLEMKFNLHWIISNLLDIWHVFRWIKFSWRHFLNTRPTFTCEFDNFHRKFRQQSSQFMFVNRKLFTNFVFTLNIQLLKYLPRLRSSCLHSIWEFYESLINSQTSSLHRRFRMFPS